MEYTAELLKEKLVQLAKVSEYTLNRDDAMANGQKHYLTLDNYNGWTLNAVKVDGGGHCNVFGFSCSIRITTNEMYMRLINLISEFKDKKK